MSAPPQIEKTAYQIEHTLKDFFRAEQEQTTLPSARAMLTVLEDFCLQGGKRIRPYLTMTSYALAKGADPSSILPVAAALELLHGFLLIHDDIMDNSALRRGKPTVHTYYEQTLQRRGIAAAQAKHYGSALGTLAGDVCYTLMLRLLNQAPLPPALATLAREEIAQTALLTMYGQELDIRFEVQEEVTTTEVLAMYKLKTAHYSFQMPLRLGARLAGASETLLQHIDTYGTACGLAFQLQDDVLGVFGTAQETGKAAGDDISAGKKTFLLLKALHAASPADRLVLQMAIGTSHLAPADLAHIRQIIKDTGTLEHCQELAQDYARQAQQALDQLPIELCDQDAKQQLSDLTSFVVERSY